MTTTNCRKFKGEIENYLVNGQNNIDSKINNVFSSRDYAHAGGAVSLALYDDRLEVWSDGMLLFGLRVVAGRSGSFKPHMGGSFRAVNNRQE